MNELRKNLPTGSSQNKIEYLAENIKNQGDLIAELGDNVEVINGQVGAMGAGDAPFNYLTNPCFDLTTNNWNWLTNLSLLSDGVDSVLLGKSKAHPAPYGWGLEIVPFGSKTPQSGSMKIVKTNNPDILDIVKGYSYRALVGAIACNAKACLFNVFTVGGAKRFDNSPHMMPFSAFCTTQSNKAGAKFGIVELNRNGDVLRVVAEQLLPVGSDRPVDSWIHNLALDVHNQYAFFVEGGAQDTDTAWHVFGVNQAGVFQNAGLLDVEPSMEGRRDRAYYTDIHNMGEPTMDDLVVGYQITPFVPMPYGMVKHCCFAYVYPYGSEEIKSNLDNKHYGLSVVKQGNVLTFKGVAKTSMTLRLEMFYSDTPLFINKV